MVLNNSSAIVSQVGVSNANLREIKWSPTGKTVAPSSTPVGRNPEQEPPAKAGAPVEGSKK